MNFTICLSSLQPDKPQASDRCCEARASNRASSLFSRAFSLLSDAWTSRRSRKVGGCCCPASAAPPQVSERGAAAEARKATNAWRFIPATSAASALPPATASTAAQKAARPTLLPPGATPWARARAWLSETSGWTDLIAMQKLFTSKAPVPARSNVSKAATHCGFVLRRATSFRTTAPTSGSCFLMLSWLLLERQSQNLPIYSQGSSG
mmetsp:Transcript_98003/g.189227  ORF Transcript_98003/g.189227 Transcript_98003/m.189227 type:complete len:208 (+) Transcript_98003:216-839(+)